MSRVNFVNKNIVLEVPAGTTLLSAARQAGIRVESPCNGEGKCGKCRIYTEQIEPTRAVLVAAGETGQTVTAADMERIGYVLACQSCVDDDLSLYIDDAARENVKILSDGKGFSHDIKSPVRKAYDAARDQTAVYIGSEVFFEPGDTTDATFGVVVDIGTTTVVAALIDTASGRELASESALNPQTEQAQDVLSRIKIASEAEGLRALCEGITKEINRLIGVISEKARVDMRLIYEVVYSGNTTMLHIAAGVNPEPLGRYPYESALSGGSYESAARLGIEISSFGRVYLPPVISAYVGADITSGILATRLFEAKGTTLFMDIGTNGEMAVSRNGELSAASTAAGPAFEGMNIEYGMRAATGAIEIVKIEDDGRPFVKTIEDAPAVGVCGSGLLDAVGELVRHGFIGPNGRFAKPEERSVPDPEGRLERDAAGKLGYRLAENVRLTQRDVRQVQLAKGAIRAGIELLLESLGLNIKDVDRIMIAGSFGYHIREASLFHIAMLPREFDGTVEFVGNTSKTGGEILLLNEDYRRETEETVSRVRVVELANDERFEKVFVRSMGF